MHKTYIYALRSLLLEDNSVNVNRIHKLKIIKLASIDISYVGAIIHNFAIYYERRQVYSCNITGYEYNTSIKYH